MTVKSVDVITINKFFVDRIDYSNKIAYLCLHDGTLESISLDILPKNIQVNDILIYENNQYQFDKNQEKLKDNLKTKIKQITNDLHKPFQSK